MRRLHRGARRQGGFTLIELMVSLVMFSLAIAGVLAVAVSLTAGFREQRQAIAAESSVRVPMDYLADAIRQASPGVPGGINLTDASAANCTSGAVSATNGTAGPDRLDVIYASGAVVTSSRSITTASSTSVDVTDVSQFAQDDYIVISDTAQGHLFKIASISGSTLNLGPQCAGTLNWPPADYPAGSLVIRAQHAEFYIGSIDGIPTLMMDPDGPQGTLEAEPLAEGVEDMQIALGVESDGIDGISEIGAAANDDEWVYNTTGEILPTGAIRAVRITLVSRASTPVSGAANLFSLPEAEDRAAGAADNYRRRVLRSTVELRNMEGSP